MRRCLAVLLLLCLPLQLSWAAVGAYCQHETGIAAQHVGHHDHQHQSTHDGDLDSPDPAKTGGVDPDCGACHAGCAVQLATTPIVIAPLPSPAAFADYRERMPASPVGQPDRPNWGFLA